MGKILLFYKYVQVQYPSTLVKQQRLLCENLGLKGRILIATEGINGTLGGSIDAIDLYKEYMKSHPLFSDVDMKESDGDADYFPRLQVTLKKTIVNFGVDTTTVTVKDGGIHLTPAETHALLEKKSKDLLILDTRNNYESRVGAFENAIKPDIASFRDLPDYIENNLEQFRDKEVLMYCTGGVRCERASAYLKLKNVAKEVYQIQGGIHRYVEQFPDGYFKGKNYVFDGRITHQISSDILAQCEECKIPFDEYSNCINAQCNKQIIICPSCAPLYHNTCSKSCLNLVQNNKVTIRIISHKIPSKMATR